MRLTHEAIRDALPRLMALLDIPEGSAMNDLAIESLADQWQALQLVGLVQFLYNGLHASCDG
jgi:hypothetical protein